jgi:DNA-binding transcriptional regulator YdaS (Cro superfamily)
MRAECSADTLYMITKKHKQAGPKLARAIEHATDGVVTRYDLRPDVFGEAPAQPAEQGAKPASQEAA